MYGPSHPCVFDLLTHYCIMVLSLICLYHFIFTRSCAIHSSTPYKRPYCELFTGIIDIFPLLWIINRNHWYFSPKLCTISISSRDSLTLHILKWPSCCVLTVRLLTNTSTMANVVCICHCQAGQFGPVLQGEGWAMSSIDSKVIQHTVLFLL